MIDKNIVRALAEEWLEGENESMDQLLEAVFMKDKQHAASIYLLSNKFAWGAGFLVGVLMLLLSGVVASEVLHSPQLRGALLLGAVMLFVSILNGAPNGVLVGLEDFKAIAINTFVGSLCEAVFMVVGAYFYRLEGAILGFGLGVIGMSLDDWSGLSPDEFSAVCKAYKEVPGLAEGKFDRDAVFQALCRSF